MPQLQAPEERPFPFVYFITIHNDSDETVTIKGRKWVVTDAGGDTQVVEGDGVVGKFPRLEPGEHFSYNSYHTIGSDSVAEGAYIGTTEEGVAGAGAHPAVRDEGCRRRIREAQRTGRIPPSVAMKSTCWSCGSRGSSARICGSKQTPILQVCAGSEASSRS